MPELHRYAGTPDRPVPPTPEHWHDVPNRDAFARDRAAALLSAGVPPYHYVDERGPTGIYRFYSYETAFGQSVSALRRDLEDAPQVYGGGALGELGAFNPNFVAPPASTAPNGAEQPLQDSAAALLAYLDANGVPNLDTPTLAISPFQQAYNADPISTGSADTKLDIDDSYGPNTFAALSAVVGAIAPPVNHGPSPAPSGGQTTPEPTPVTDATCTAWAADTATPQAIAIATSIAFHDSPVTWTDQGEFNTTINGVDYLFLMHWENGLKAVVAWKCTAGSGAGTTPTTAAASSSTGAIVAVVLVVGALVATGFAARKPLAAMYHRRRA